MDNSIKDYQVKRIKEYKETGDKSIRDELIKNNIPLVKSRITKLKGNYLAKDDYDCYYISGLIGLWKAINRYDYDRFSNQSFSTYATYLIDNEINNVPSSFSTTTIGNEKKIKQIKAVEKDF